MAMIFDFLVCCIKTHKCKPNNHNHKEDDKKACGPGVEPGDNQSSVYRFFIITHGDNLLDEFVKSRIHQVLGVKF